MKEENGDNYNRANLWTELTHCAVEWLRLQKGGSGKGLWILQVEHFGEI